MRASHTLIALASGLPLLLGATAALAHVDLLSPPPRLGGEAGGNQLKTKPCGQTTNKRTTDKVTTYAPGQKVDIKIKEYVNHPGYFAVAFDPDGDDNFPFPIANADKVNKDTDDPKATFPLSATVLGLRTDKEKDCYAENTTTRECAISITIPNMNCANCTLQVIQFMYDKLGDNNDNEYYYQCADIKIEGAVGGGGGGSGGAGGATAGGATAGGATAGGSAAMAGSGGAPGAAGSASGGMSAGGALGSAGIRPGGGTATTTTAGTGGTGTVAPPNAAEDDGGCGIAKRTQSGAGALTALGLLFGLVRRRRAR